MLPMGRISVLLDTMCFCLGMIYFYVENDMFLSGNDLLLCGNDLLCLEMICGNDLLCLEMICFWLEMNCFL